MLIVMMNLLISIVGDTFERVQMEAAVKDAEETIELIMEWDTVQFWNRLKSLPKRIVACLPYSEESEGDWEGRMLKLFQRLNRVQSEVERNTKTLEEV